MENRPRTLTCSHCNIEKPIKNFPRRNDCRDGRIKQCRICVNIKRQAYRKIKGRQETPAQYRKWILKSKFGLSIEDYNSMFEKQNGVCAICFHKEKQGKHLGVDHCHTTSRIRGLLCSECNNGIGKLKDDPILLQRAIEYLNGR